MKATMIDCIQIGDSGESDNEYNEKENELIAIDDESVGGKVRKKKRRIGKGFQQVMDVDMARVVPKALLGAMGNPKFGGDSALRRLSRKSLGGKPTTQLVNGKKLQVEREDRREAAGKSRSHDSRYYCGNLSERNEKRDRDDEKYERVERKAYKMALDRTTSIDKKRSYAHHSEKIRTRDSFTCSLITKYNDTLDENEQFDSQKCVESIDEFVGLMK